MRRTPASRSMVAALGFISSHPFRGANACPRRAGSSGKVCVKARLLLQSGAGEDVHDVAVLHEVGLALQPVDAVLLGLLHRAEAAEVVVADDLGADEAAGQVGV